MSEYGDFIIEDNVLVRYRGNGSDFAFPINAEFTSIGKMAFSGVTGLKSISIPDGVTTIGARAFQGCLNLEAVILPNSLTTIEGEAFSGCWELKSVNIPDKIQYVAPPLFSGSSNVTLMGSANSNVEKIALIENIPFKIV